MATVPSQQPSLVERMSSYYRTMPHEIWDQFSVEQREQMLADDRDAGHRVSLILSSLVTAGLLLALVTLVAIVLTS